MSGPVYTHTASYEPAGVKTETHQSGRVVTYSRDGPGRVTGVTGQKSGVPTNYVTTVSYAAHGGAASSTFGGGAVESSAWNYRLQPASIGRGTAFSLSYGYCGAGVTVCGTNNGNVTSQGIGYAVVTQSYRY